MFFNGVKPMSSKAATIGKIKANGTTHQMWTTTDHGGKTHSALIAAAVKSQKLTDPGIYIVSAMNPAGMPVGSAFTITRSGDTLEVHAGVPLSGRVNRWPPRAA